MRPKLKGRGKFKTDTRDIPEMKSNETYEESPQILTFVDRIKECRGETVGNSTGTYFSCDSPSTEHMT